MIKYCRQIYSNDEKTLNILNEFEENFLSELSIYWYTRESFLYKILNRALWTSQSDILYKLRYFLRQLHKQISSQAELQHSNKTTFIVYRGQNMSIDQIEKLKKNIGGFLSFSNFLSTSLKRYIALSFIAGSNIGVLFEIYIDTKIKKFPFANIEHLSYQQGEYNESELLFSMGTVFRMVGMDTEDDFYRVQLMLTDDIDQKLEQYTKNTREKTYSTHSFLSLLKLMYELKQYNSVDCFAQMFNNDKSLIIDQDLHNEIHNIFGLTCLHRGQFNDALKYFDKSLNLCFTLSADHSKLANVYDNIGSVHLAQSNYETAITHYELALDCEINSDDPDVSLMIKSATNVASILHNIGKYEDVLECYKRVLELQKEYLGENDKSLTDTYNILSMICYEMDDYEGTSLF
jgi:tetratricopeptide (TPR) repeat protein